MFHRVARVEEIPPGTGRCFVVGKTPIVLARWEGGISALFGICPHQGNPLNGAQVWGTLLTCPWHNFQFDVRTGENHYPKNVYPPDLPHLAKQVRPLTTYPVEIRDGEIWVDVK